MEKEYLHINKWIFHRGFEVHWFSGYGDWFVYLRYKTPLPHIQEIRELRFSSAGFMKSKYILK
jgi:hypothetical protein